MRALTKENGKIALRKLSSFGLPGPKEVQLQVKLAGLCRTDLYVAEGRIKTPEPMILGHECTGVVDAVGAEVRDLERGQAVALSPWIGCGVCDDCDTRRPDLCPHAKMVGLHQDGVFCDSVIVPRAAVYTLPPGFSWERGAFVEPVAACLGVLNAPIASQDRGVILGEGRIAQLTHRIVAAYGFSMPEPLSLEEALDLPDRSMDFVIETSATPAYIDQMIRILRPKGTLVLKSRPPAPVPMDLWAMTRKELRLYTVHYGSFATAIDLLSSDRFWVDDLFGEQWSLELFKDAFDAARGKEAKKQFLVM